MDPSCFVLRTVACLQAGVNGSFFKELYWNSIGKGMLTDSPRK